MAPGQEDPFVKGLESYERLEFLGDAVLRLVVSEHLYRDTHEDEGELSKRRDSFVKEESATKVAERLGLWQHLLLSEGEKSQKPNPRILAEAYEAYRAIYLDQDFGTTSRFVSRTLIKNQ